jgi:alpha-beta hydrolase superfamily lysophospholipase
MLPSNVLTYISNKLGSNDMIEANEIREMLSPLPAPDAQFMEKVRMSPSDSSCEEVVNYLKFYGLGHENHNGDMTHILGTFQCDDNTLVGQIHIPVNYKAVIVALHGYLSHAGQFKHFIKHFTDNGYAIAHFDLPGHGLSTGPGADIEDFADYTRALRVFTDYVTSLLNSPYHLVGFSTGGAVAFDYMINYPDNIYSDVIFAAPLVHSAAWGLARISYMMYSPFIQKVPRIHRNNSCDKEFLHFNRYEDYLHWQEVPLRWFKSLQEWNGRIAKVEPAEKKALIIQGTKDVVIDYAYSIDFIKQKLPNTSVSYIDGGHHELFNESEPMRNHTFEIIDQYLQ